MGIKNKSALKKSWFVLVDKSYEFNEIAEDYSYPVSRYDCIAIGSADMDMDMSQRVAGFRISATRPELVDLLRDFKETYPDAHIMVMKS